MAIDAGSIYSALELKADGFFKTLNKADRETDKFKSKLEEHEKRMDKLGSSLTRKVSLPLAGVGIAAIKVGADFEEGMSNVEALSGATGKDLQALEDIARKMGAGTKYSAKEASEGLQYMALAGWNTEQMIAGLEPALLLAGAAGMELGTATDIMTDTMSMFGMEAEEATKMTDMLAYAQANSNTDVEQLGEALKYSGAAANAMGYDLADTAAILGVFADQGLKGSAAGTTLNAMFRDMKDKSKDGAIAIGETNVAIVDSQGNYRDMADIMADVETATKGMTMAERDQALGAIFGTQAIKGVNMVMEAGTDTLKDFEAGMRDSDGASKDMYDTMQNNLKGAWEELKSAIQEAGLSLAETLIPMISNLVGWLQKWIDSFNNLGAETQEIIVKVGLLAMSLGPVLSIGSKLLGGGMKIANLLGGAGGLVNLIGSTGGAAIKLSGSMGLASGATGGLSTVLAALASPAGIAVVAAAAIAGIGVAAYKTAKHLKEDAIPEVDLFGEGVSETTAKAVGDFMELENEATTSLMELSFTGGAVTDEMKEKIGGNFKEMKDTIVNASKEQKDETLEHMKELFADSTEISQVQAANLISTTEEQFNGQIEKTQRGEERIQEILAQANEEKRELKNWEKNLINKITNEMKEDAVKVLSESEAEQMIIMENIKNSAGDISARQAAEVVKNSATQRDGRIAEAEEEYKESMRIAMQLKTDGTDESIEAANNIIAEAERKRDGTVKEAEEMHKDIVGEAKKQAKDHVNEVDWETGEILTRWQSLKKNTKTNLDEMVKNTKESWKTSVEDTKTQWNEQRKSISESWKGIKQNTKDSSKNILDEVSRKWSNTKENTRNTWENMKQTTSSKWNSMKNDTRTSASNVLQSIRDSWRSASNDTASKWNNISNSVSTKTGEVKKSVFDNIGKSSQEWKNRTDEMLSAAKSKFSDMASAVGSAFSKIRDSISSGIDKLREWNNQRVENKTSTFTTVNETVNRSRDATPARNAHGTNFFTGGLSWVGEQGPELVEMPKGSKVHTNRQSEELLSRENKGITQSINIYSPKALNPSEIARKQKQASRQLAMEWGV